jgi:calcium binding protein 39
MSQLIQNIERIPFEGRKDAALIFNNLMRKNVAGFSTYILDNFQLVTTLIEGYMNPYSALSCGSMVRECVRHDSLASAILYSDDIWAFFEVYVHLPNFEVASDAFNSLRDLLTTSRNKTIAAKFLETNYDNVFHHYDLLFKKGNYVTKRRSLKLLGELLLDRSNFNIMMRYISSKDNLKVMYSVTYFFRT